MEDGQRRRRNDRFGRRERKRKDSGDGEKKDESGTGRRRGEVKELRWRVGGEMDRGNGR